MNRNSLSIALVVLLGLAAGKLDAQTRMEKGVISTGGGRTSSATKFFDYTIGQPVVGVASSSTTVGQFGFWNLVLAPSSVDVTTGAGGVTALSVSPNPMVDDGTIRVILARSGPVEVVLYDVNGRAVRTLLSDDRPAGELILSFDGKGLAAGTYFVAVSVPGALLERPVTVVR